MYGTKWVPITLTSLRFERLGLSCMSNMCINKIYLNVWCVILYSWWIPGFTTRHKRQQTWRISVWWYDSSSNSYVIVTAISTSPVQFVDLNFHVHNHWRLIGLVRWFWTDCNNNLADRLIDYKPWRHSNILRGPVAANASHHYTIYLKQTRYIIRVQ